MELRTEIIVVDGEPVEVTRSSGNVFADLELPDADELFAKAEILHELRKAIEATGLSQRQVAKLLDSDQARVSEIMNFKMSNYTLDRLIGFMNKLNKNVEIVIRDKPARQKKPAFLSVRTVGPKSKSSAG